MEEPESRTVAIALARAIDQVVKSAKQVEIERRLLLELLRKYGVAEGVRDD